MPRSKYPDILRRLPALLKGSVTSCVLDCEAVAYDTENKQILPFQVSDESILIATYSKHLSHGAGVGINRHACSRRAGHFNVII